MELYEWVDWTKKWVIAGTVFREGKRLGKDNEQWISDGKGDELNWLMYEMMYRWIYLITKLWMNESMKEWINELTNEWVKELTNKWTHERTNKFTEPTNKRANERTTNEVMN